MSCNSGDSSRDCCRLATLVWALLAVYPYIKWVALANIPYLLSVAFATVLQLTVTYLNW